MAASFLSPALCSGAFNLDIKGMPKLKSYYNDLFHTLVNVSATSSFSLVLACEYHG